MRYRLLLMAFITGLTSYIGKAQNYPISANLMMMPPYSVYLTDYSSHTVPRMQVNLLLKDLRASNVKVRFRATIKGPGIVISTKENYYGTPVYLDGGAPLNLSQSDFFDYFLPENMDFNGISRREIDRTGRLPEGIYQFSFEVLDYNRGTIISNKALAFAWLILNDPPLINYPRDGEKLKPALPQQIMFNWAPRHAGSPNSAFITQYKFELIEVWPAERNPNEAFDVLSPLFVTSTPATSLVYGPTDPLLEPGRTYAVRVQAIPEQNHSSLELFKNKGYSEVISFKYGDPCLVPDNIRISANSHNKIVLEWDSRPVFSAYHVKYQPAGAEEWYELNPIINKTQLDALQPETTYHYTLAGECGPFMSDYSPEGTIRMDKEPASLVNCAAPMPAIDISTMEILTHLSPGAYVTAGDFVVQVTEAYPSGNQSFSGKGIIKVPFFKNARANVLFSNIKVSNTYQLISGGVKVIGGKLVLPEKIRTISDSLDQLLTMADEMLNEAARVYDTLQEVLQIPEDKAPDAGEAQRAETAKSDSTSLDGNITKADSTFLEESTTKTDTLLADTNSPNDSLNSDNNTNNPDSGTTATGESSTIASKTTGEEETASFSTNSALSREMQFGPLRVHFPEVPVSAEKNENGLCRFAELLAEVELMINTGFYTEKFTLPTTDFSFLQYCDSAHFTDVSFSWEGKKTLSPLNWLKISLIKAEISLSPEGRINGSLQIKPDLEGLIEISSMAALRGLDAGTITYYFDNTQGFSGRFDFSQLTDLEVIIQKGQEVLYDMSGVSFDADGNIELEVENNTGAEWATDMLITRITSLGINARLSVWEGFSLINGNINMELEGLPGFSGPLKFSTAVSNGLLESTIHSENIQAFGMALSVPQLTVILDKNLDVRQISGHMGVQHPDFDSQLEINDFTIADSRLTSFSGSGKINYEGLNINILSSEYLEKENVLSLNALVEIAHNGNYVSATLSKFTISPDGTITLGDYSYAGSLTQDFGPVKVVFSTQPSPTGKEGRYKVYQDVEATVFLKMNEGEKKQEKEITKVMLTYKQTSKGAWKEFEAHWKGTGIPLGNINHLDTKITGIDISMEDDKNTKITGSVNCAAKLTNDLKLSEIHEGFKSSTGFDVIIKKGAETNASFSFSGYEEGFDGSWTMGTLRKINLLLLKEKALLAKVENGSWKEGRIEGTLIALPNATFKSSHGTIKVKTMSLGVSFYPFEDNHQFKLTKGKAGFEVAEIKGLKGSLLFNCDFDAENIIAKVDNRSTISGYGLSFADFNITASFNRQFEPLIIEGSMSGKHAKFNTSITIDQFIIENGALATLVAKNSRVNYQGFDFELNNLAYTEKLLDISAKVELNLGGDGAKLVVDKFHIDSTGTVTIGAIKGRLDKSPVLMEFAATFEEQRFKGDFNGEFGDFFGLSGTIDIGRQEDYHFGYLSLKSSANIPVAPGIKISRLSGNLGYNYRLNYNTTKKTFTGTPYKGNYLIGFGLGLSDQANIMEIYGNPILQFGKDRVELAMIGTVSVPRKAPNFSGKLNVNYNLTDNIVRGNLSSDIMVPAKSGTLIKGKNLSFDFYHSESSWSVESTHLQATVLKVLTFSGNIDLVKKENGLVFGSLDGMADFHYDYTMTGELWIGTFTGKLELGFNAMAQLTVTEQEVSGKVSSTIYGSIDLLLTSKLLGEVGVSTSFSGSAQIERQNSKNQLDAEVDFQFEVMSEKVEYSREINIEI